MKTQTFKKAFYLIPLVLLTSIFMLSDSALAYPYLPYLDYTADFNYLYSHDVSQQVCTRWNKNSVCTKWETQTTTVYDNKLTYNSWNITGGNYVNGSYFNEGADPITGATITIGNLYNASYPNNLYFDNTAGSGGGPVSFTISNGATTYLSAQLDNFIITDNTFSTQLNPLFDFTKADLTNITFTPNGSQYIQDLQSSYLSHGYLNISMDFAFSPGGISGGGYAFTNDATGSIQGKMAVTPEPISSILFITGGATLAVRRYLKKKNK